MVVKRDRKAAFYDARASRGLDEAVRQGLPISGIELMRRAARAAFDILLREYPHARRWLVFAGKGNNAGDAYLIASLAQAQGLEVDLRSVVECEELEGDAAIAHAEARAAGVPISRDIEFEASAHDLVVDGLLGTGFHGALRPAYAEAVACINNSGLPVIGIDIPSGVDASTGGAQEAIRAERTVTFISRKVGTFTGAGKACSGTMHFADLGVPPHLYPAPSAGTCSWYSQRLPEPSESAYKHQLGQVLVVGGDRGMPGAVAMAAEAALRVGAGMVTVATHPEYGSALLGRLPEAMTVDASGAQFRERLEVADIVVLGPGLGRNVWGEERFSAVVDSGLPVVLDADGLYWLSKTGKWQGGPLYMTPHAAEASALLSVSVAEIEQDRIGSACLLAERFNARVVLKGPGSVLRLTDHSEICTHGNQGMASAGMGDVLAGIAGGVLAGAIRSAASQALLDARFSAGVALHSAAADRAAARVGRRSLIATDVILALPETMMAAGVK